MRVRCLRDQLMLLRPVLKNVDYEGVRYGDWTVLDRATVRKTDRGGYVYKWFCRCACGNEQWVTRTNLLSGRTNRCCKCHRKQLREMAGSKHPNWRGSGCVPQTIYYNVLRNAARRNIPVQLTIEELSELFHRQDARCALSGIPLQMGKTASLDRVRSDKPYVISNVQWVHKTINMMKASLKQGEFLEICHRVATHDHNGNGNRLLPP